MEQKVVGVGGAEGIGGENKGEMRVVIAVH